MLAAMGTLVAAMGIFVARLTALSGGRTRP